MSRPDWTTIIHVAKAQLKLDDNAYRALLSGAAQVDSASDIRTPAQFAAVMEAFKNLGFVSLGTPRGSAKARPGRWGCTPAQRGRILALWHQKARNPTMPALAAFVKRTTGVDSFAFLVNREASKVIVALEKLEDSHEAQPE
jgi:hypothetical protein